MRDGWTPIRRLAAPDALFGASLRGAHIVKGGRPNGLLWHVPSPAHPAHRLERCDNLRTRFSTPRTAGLCCRVHQAIEVAGARSSLVVPTEGRLADPFGPSGPSGPPVSPRH